MVWFVQEQDLNQGLQDGRRRWNHGVMTAHMFDFYKLGSLGIKNSLTYKVNPWSFLVGIGRWTIVSQT